MRRAKARPPRMDADGNWLRFNTEAELQAALEVHAGQLGFKHYHTRRSEGSNKGFPDLVICGHGLTMYVECKGPTGRTSAEQEEWLHTLAEAGNIVFLATTERNGDYEEICAEMDRAYEEWRTRP